MDWESDPCYWEKYVEREAQQEKRKEAAKSLYYLAKGGNLDKVKSFLKQDFLGVINDKVYVYDESQTCLVASVLNNNFEVAEYLLSQGADIKEALCVCVERYYKYINVCNCERRIKFLIEHGANYDGNDLKILRLKQQALFLKVIKKGDLEKIRQCLADGADVNATNYLKNETALMVTCQKGNFEVALTLISVGADINAKDKDGKTVLNYAAEGGNAEIMKLLLSQGAVRGVKK